MIIRILSTNNEGFITGYENKTGVIADGETYFEVPAEYETLFKADYGKFKAEDNEIKYFQNAVTTLMKSKRKSLKSTLASWLNIKKTMEDENISTEEIEEEIERLKKAISEV